MIEKREKIALGLFIFGILWYFGENFYFGWHLHVQSAVEGVADFMVWVFWGLAFFIRPTRIEKHESIINANHVEMTNNQPKLELNKNKDNLSRMEKE